MKVLFLKAGKYRDSIKVIEVSGKDVESEKVFEVDANKASYYINAKVAEMYEEVVKAKPDGDDFDLDLDKMTVPQLEEFAEKNEIDLGEAKNKAEKLEVIKLALSEKTGDGE